MMRSVRFLAAVLLALLIIPAIAKAQNVASVTGTVTDKTGAAVPGASVKIVDTRTGNAYFAKTAGDGGYRILELSPGPGYALTVKKDGFQTLVVSSLYLPVATATTQDVRLEVGTLNQTIEVTAEGSVTLNTTDATIGNNFDMRAVAELPNQARDNPALLLERQPGVTPTVDTTDDPLGSRGGAVTGARADQSNIVVDGIDAEDFGLGQAFGLTAAIPVGAVQEFRTEVANPVSDTGRGSGATTFITTKGGSNQWHGEAFEYNRTALTEANDYFNQLSGTPRQGLIRNQFGGNVGGPILKDKLFFFFDYDGRRDRKSDAVLRIVPLPNLTALATNGPGAGINYINNGAGCDKNSRLNTTPGCITLLAPTGACGSQTVQGLDPLCIGADAALASFVAGRYPKPNDLTAGDGVNTGGFRFNAPAPLTENIYLGRIDYNVSSKHKLFTRFNFNNQKNADDRNNISPATGIPASVAFPNDPPTAVDTENDKAWVIGDTWTITPNTINQFVYGETRGQADFGIAFNPNGTNFQFAWMDSAVDPPYLRQSTQSHIIPVPTFRDDWSQIHGSHSLAFGGVFKPIRTRDVQVNDFNFIGLGLNPLTPSLSTTSPTPSLRPANILNDPALDPSGVALSDWDNAFMNMLGSWWLDVGVFNYNKSGTALGLGVPHRVDYRYYEYEFYGQDSWRVTKSLTLTYGLRYQYDSVPYESKGLEGVSTVTFQQEFSPRVANGMNGVSTFEPSPFLTYALGGKANPGAPSLYKSDPTNFSPRLAIAWNPSGSSGLLGKWLGDRKTVFRGSASLIYDHTALNSINFIQDQNSFLFSTQAGGQFGGAGAFTDLATDPRFTGINDLPVSAQTPPVAPPFVNPLTPNVVSGGVAVGQVSGIDNYTVDQNFKTPYALAFSADMQRELRGGVQLDVGWVGRYGRRLIALADANQLVDFNDAGANQSLFQAISALEVEARANVVTPTEQPIFEDPNFCLELEPAAETCTQFIYSNFFRPLQLGGLGSIVNAMNSNLFSATADWGFTPGAGQSSQFQSNVYLTNKGWSSYNGLLITLRKRFSHNLQGDFNYTFAHSLDNISLIADNIGNQAGTSPGVLCDVRSGKVCRGNSEFDLTHSIVADVIYALPFGRGQWMGKDASIWLDELIGGWGISDITSWRSGFPYNAFSGVQTTSLFADSIGIFDGNRAAIATHRHVNPVDKTVQIFANQAAAIGAFGPPTGQQVGQRNVLRGPRFSSWDMALTKKFDLGTERCGLELRMEAYNVFNHTNFALPDNAITSAQFGVISNTAGTPRQMQFALRFTF